MNEQLGIRRTADLHLRGHGGAVAVRVRWPSDGGDAPPLVVFLPESGPANGVAGTDDGLCDEICSELGAVTLCTPWSARGGGAPYSPLERASAALEWSADHAAELGADPGRIMVAGRGAGAAAAVVLAVRARDRGWPGIVRQILFLTTPRPESEGGGACDTARSALGIAGNGRSGPPPAAATIVAGAGIEAARHRARCARRLRGAGVAVEELGLNDRAALWSSLRAALRRPPAELATGREGRR